MGGNEVVALEVDVGLPRVVEVDIGAAVGGGEGVYLNEGLGGLEFLGVEDVEDGAGIVDGGEGEFVVVEVHDLELLQHVVDGLGEGDCLVALEVVQHALRRHVLVGHLERDHHEWDVALQPKHLVEGVRVEEDVEFGSRGDVALADRPSHHHDFNDLLFEFGVSQQQDAKVSERAGVGPDDLSGMVHDPLEDLLEAAFSDCLFGRSGQLHASESIGAVHMLS